MRQAVSPLVWHIAGLGILGQEYLTVAVLAQSWGHKQPQGTQGQVPENEDDVLE
jgi:hypothetical protein